jgi:hypothetical protein
MPKAREDTLLNDATGEALPLASPPRVVVDSELVAVWATFAGGRSEMGSVLAFSSFQVDRALAHVARRVCRGKHATRTTLPTVHRCPETGGYHPNISLKTNYRWLWSEKPASCAIRERRGNETNRDVS